MEKFLNPYDKEAMRIAMLSQEETFREQVYELHRLYRIQKLLMKSIETQYREANWVPAKGFSYGQPKNLRADDKFNPIEESEIVLTLGMSPSNYRRVHNNRDRSDSEPSFSSFSANCIRSVKNKDAHRNPNEVAFVDDATGVIQLRDVGVGFRNGARRSNDVEEQISRERLNHPSWLFKVLSL